MGEAAEVRGPRPASLDQHPQPQLAALPWSGTQPQSILAWRHWPPFRPLYVEGNWLKERRAKPTELEQLSLLALHSAWPQRGYCILRASLDRSDT